MGSASWQPKWWTEEHATTWAKTKEAMKRDWEQTKADLHLGGKELDQNVGDTLKQATGKEPIPGPNTPNHTAGAKRGTDLDWADAEQPLMFGMGARRQFGREHATWNNRLEATLKSDWESAGNGVHRSWDEVKNVVRHGYDRARH